MNISSHLENDQNYFEKVEGNFEDWIVAVNKNIQPDFFAEAYAGAGMKIAWAIFYVLIALVVFGLARVAWFERSGEAGHYRTVVNQLMSFNIDQICLYFAIPVTFNTLRAFVGPLPRLMCKSSVYIKNIVLLNVAQISLLMTLAKFVFLCYFKSIPVMEDNFLSVFGYMIINLISVLATIGRFYMPGKPTLNELICTGCFYEEWTNEVKPPSTDSLIQLGCFLTHLILSIPISLKKMKLKETEPKLTGVTFGSYLASWIILGFLLSACTSVIAMNNMNPGLLHQFPYNLLIFWIHLFIPLSVTATLLFSFIAKSKRLRKFLGIDFTDNFFTVNV